MKMKRNILINILILAVILNVSTLSAGSILSSFGLGQPAINYNTRAMGMGFISVSQDNPFYLNMINPAALYRIKTTMISVQYISINNKYSDSEASTTSNYSNVNGFAFALPVSSQMGFSIQFSPKTRVNYKFGFTGNNDGFDYTQSVEGRGGLNNFKVSAFLSPLPRLSLGVAALFTFGRIDETWAVDYESSQFSSTADMFLSRNKGFGFTLGFIYRPIKQLSIGAVYTPSIKLDTNTDTSYRFKTDKYTSSSNHLLPSWFKSGASFTLYKKLILSTEYGFTKWTEFKYNDTKLQNTKDVTSLSFGFEFVPASKPTDSYIKKISYRAGFCMQPYFYLSPNGQTIDEQWITFGLGFPMYGGSKIDFAFNFGKRGSLNTNGIEEKIFRLGISVTTGEKWFIRRY